MAGARKIGLALFVSLALGVAASGSASDSSRGAAGGNRSGDASAEKAGEEAGERSGETDEQETEAPRERSAWFLDQRAYPNRTLPSGVLRRAIGQRDALRDRPAPITPSDVATLAFSPVGPHPITTAASTFYVGNAPVSGRVTSLAPHPTDPNTAYLGSATGGVWKTTDGGTNWSPTFDGQQTISIGAVALDPATPSTVYAGTGEGDEFDSYLTSGLYKSTDSGATWTKIGGTTFDNCNFYDFAVRPGVGGTLYAAAAAGGRDHGAGLPNTCSGARGGIYRSTDGGLTWTLVLHSAARFTDISVDPTTTTKVFAAAWGGGVFRSADAGATWSDVGLPAYAGRAAVAVAPTDTNRVYAVTTNGSYNTQGIYTSADGGVSWAAQPLPTTLCDIGGITGAGQCWYDLTLTVDSADSSVFYAGGPYLHKFTSNGAANARIGQSGGGATIHVDFHALQFGAGSGLWVGSDGGAYRSTDAGGTFSNLNNDLEISQFIGIAGRGGPTGPIIGGTQDNGSLLYNGSVGWPMVRGGDGGYSAADSVNANLLYSTYQNGYLARSTDGGTTWSDVGSFCGTGCLFYSPIVAHPSVTNVLYAGTNTLRRSTNSGTNWLDLGAAFPTPISAIGVATSNIDAVYAGTRTGAIRRTADAGVTWTNGIGLPARFVTDIKVNPSNPLEAWATVSGFGTGHVWHTTDGVNWANTSGNLPDAPVNALEVNWSTGVIYLGTDVGVLRSVDGGASWTYPTTGIPNVIVLDLLLDPAAQTLTAGTFGRGAWRAPISADLTPTNDNFAAATALASAGTLTGDNSLATKEAGEPTVLGLTGGHSVWYSVQLPFGNSLHVDSCGSAFDTMIGVYTGSAVNALSVVIENDDSPDCGTGSVQSSVNYTNFSAPTQSLSVMLEGFNASSVGNFTLNWQQTVSNDNFANARVLTGATGSTTNANSLATKESGEPDAASNTGGKSVWYSYTPAASGDLTLNTCASDFDTTLNIYTGAAVNALTSGGGSDDSCGLQSQLSNVPVTAGTPYRIQVDGYNSGSGAASGAVNLAWSFAPSGPLVSIGDATVVEGDGGTTNARFAVRLSSALAVPVTVQYNTANGTATTGAPADYSAKVAQTLTIPAGKTGATISIPVKGDGRAEPPEDFTVTLSAPTNAAIGRSVGTATILNDDMGTTPAVSIGDVNVIEGHSLTAKATFDVTLDVPATGTVTVPWSTSPGTATAGSDYVTASGTLSFPAGTTSKTVAVTVNGDTVSEPDEIATINLGAPVGAVIADGSGSLIISNDDVTAATSISIGDVTVTEGDTKNHSATFPVRLASAQSGGVTVHYTTVAGSASATTDYTTKTGTLTIPAGQVSANIAVSIVADALDDAATETFNVVLSAPTGGATLFDAAGQGAINDDDPGSSILGIGEGSAVEGQGGTATVQVPITLTQPQTGPVTVVVNTVNGTAGAGDFTATVNKLITIPAGTTTATITITIQSDLIAEPTEAFNLVLSAPSGATLGRTTGTYLIIDDD